MESLKSTVTKLTQQYLSTEHSVLQKAVSDLSNKIDNLQTQESKLSEQIKSTSDALGKHPASSAQLVSNRKSNVVVYGVEENPPKTPRNVWLQKDMETVSQIFNSINVCVDPTHTVFLTVSDLADSNYSKQDLDLFCSNFSTSLIQRMASSRTAITFSKISLSF